jgi:uncharacterized SAM-dependent methyltransferase
MKPSSPRSSIARVTFHSSAFPDQVKRDLLQSLRTRQLNHKFHYDSIKQTQKWLALHQAYSPSRTDPDCAATYDRSFKAVAAQIKSKRVHLLGLGCGGGQKDARLLKLLQDVGKTTTYTPLDVSSAMVLVAKKEAAAIIEDAKCFPVVCDLGSEENWAEALGRESTGTRLITFFGMMPNFEPDVVLPRLARLVRPGDHLLLSANLAPGKDYDGGVKKILPLYDNEPTRDWLMTFLTDLGVEREDGRIQFVIEEIAMRSKKRVNLNSLRRVAAYFDFDRGRELVVFGEKVSFHAGEKLRLFFSYRHTPALMRELILPYGLEVIDQWVTRSEEEAVFLVRASPCNLLKVAGSCEQSSPLRDARRH